MSNYLNAKIAQLVEHDLAKVGVAGSSPVFRSEKRDEKAMPNHSEVSFFALNSDEIYIMKFDKSRFYFVYCPDGEIGRHASLRGWWP